jgi:NAD(P)-dependent dehydrogenase (short-subunit alcohol dehydrogenase family)
MMDGVIGRFAGMRNMDNVSISTLVSSDVPLRRVARPTEIASTCFCLTRDDLSSFTSAVLMVDGGAAVVDVGRVAIGRCSRRLASGNIFAA